jgi:hypothetical protein
MAHDVDLLSLYAHRMAAMKKRMARIDAIFEEAHGLKAARVFAEDDEALESFALQFRKVLELIAFSGMVANKVAYEDAHADFAKNAYPASIGRRLDSVHPTWFPRHVTVERHPGMPQKLVFVRPADSDFDRKRWQQFYDVMGVILHVRNPFAGGVQLNLDIGLLQAHTMVKRHMTSHVARVLSGPPLLCELGTWPVGDCEVSAAVWLEAALDTREVPPW